MSPGALAAIRSPPFSLETTLASRTVEEPYRSLLERVRRDLDNVEVAMARLADGTYGHCEACDATLSEEQLASAPAASRCPKCR